MAPCFLRRSSRRRESIPVPEGPLCCEERIETVFSGLLVHPNAGVNECHADVFGLRRDERSGGGVVQVE